MEKDRVTESGTVDVDRREVKYTPGMLINTVVAGSDCSF